MTGETPDTLQAALDLLLSGDLAGEHLAAVAAALEALEPSFLGAIIRLDPLGPVFAPAPGLPARLGGPAARALTEALTGEIDRLLASDAVLPARVSVEIDLAGAPLLVHMDLALDTDLVAVLAPRPESATPARPTILGALVWEIAGGDSRSPDARARATRALAAALGRRAALSDLACHQRALDLVTHLYEGTLRGRLTHAGVSQVLETLARLLPLEVIALALPHGRRHRLICRFARGMPAGVLAEARAQVAYALGISAPPDEYFDEERIEGTPRVPGRRKRRAGTTIGSSFMLPLGRPGNDPSAGVGEGAAAGGGGKAGAGVGMEAGGGVLALFARQPHAFSMRDVRLISLLSPALATCLKSARSLSMLQQENSQLAKEKARRDFELELAHEVQARLLPPATLRLSGLEVAASCVPCGSVGGDLYHLRPFDADRLGLLIADISGKGVAAALLMAEMRGVLKGIWGRETLGDDVDPASLLALLEKHLGPDLGDDGFVTASACLIDPTRGRLRYAHAGHEPIMRIRKDSLAILPTDGPPLGVQAGFPYQCLEAQVIPGDLLLLTTDGVAEARGEDADMFGRDRLARVAVELGGMGAEEASRTVALRVAQFARARPPSDDLTVVAIKILER